MTMAPVDPTAFSTPASFSSWTRIIGLVLSPHGERLVATVLSASGEGGRFIPSLWEIDPAGKREPLRITWSDRGESKPGFTAAGELLFLSNRAGAGPGANLWCLPSQGEARPVVQHPGGVKGFAVARAAGMIAYSADLLPGTTDAASSAKVHWERRAAGADAVLHEAGPTRYLNRDLGPEEPHVFIRGLRGAADVNVGGLGQGWVQGSDVVLSHDGALIAYTRNTEGHVPDDNRTTVVVSDTRSGDTVHTVDGYRRLHYSPVFTADGTGLVCRRELQADYDRPPRETLVHADLTTGTESDLLEGHEHWAREVAVSPVPGDGTVWFTADEQGRSPIFRRDQTGAVTRLTSVGAYTSLCVSPDARTLYALRSAPESPPCAVRLDAAAPDQEPAALPSPGGVGALPGTLTEVHAWGSDGFPLRGWLALPEGASSERKAPLLVCVHGGPHTSWASWSWHWNPWVFTARGYAVLLPDPALSTGYGGRMLERGWGQWSGHPYSDIMALTDTAEVRPDIDGTRTSLAGASFGGYLANRIATKTERFRAIVSCAGQWDLRSFQSETDSPWQFQRFLGDPLTQPERYESDSPNLDAASVRTPMLVSHGGRDYRVPVAQSMALFQDLQRFGVPVKFLYFPRESHGVTAPGNLALRYSVILNFLDHHVRGAPWQRPPLL